MRILFILIAAILFCEPAFAQSINIDLGNGGGKLSSQILQLVALITVISLAPSILVMVTSFTRIIVVLSFLRSAIGLQQTPPNSVMVSLALFLTLFIMEPVFMESYNNGIKPMINNEITEEAAIDPIVSPFKKFMLTNTREEDIDLFLEIANINDIKESSEVPLKIVIPSFMISELKRAFEIGFLIFIPFLIIDMMVSSTLMAMGMMMLPPVLISLPFKLVFFVLIDGWHLIIGSLLKSFG